MDASIEEKLMYLMFELECVNDQLDQNDTDKNISAHITCFNDAIEAILDGVNDYAIYETYTGPVEENVGALKTAISLRGAIRDAHHALYGGE